MLQEANVRTLPVQQSSAELAQRAAREISTLRDGLQKEKEGSKAVWHGLQHEKEVSRSSDQKLLDKWTAEAGKNMALQMQVDK